MHRVGLKFLGVSLLKEAVIYVGGAFLIGALLELFRGALMKNNVDYFPANLLFVGLYLSALTVPTVLAGGLMCYFSGAPNIWVRVGSSVFTATCLAFFCYSANSLIGSTTFAGILMNLVSVFIIYRFTAKRKAYKES